MLLVLVSIHVYRIPDLEEEREEEVHFSFSPRIPFSFLTQRPRLSFPSLSLPVPIVFFYAPQRRERTVCFSPSLSILFVRTGEARGKNFTFLHFLDVSCTLGFLSFFLSFLS